MAEDRTLKMIELINNKTQDSAIAWRETNNESAFLTSFSNYSIEISQSYNSETDDLDYTITLYNSEGKVVERIYDNNLIREYPHVARYMRELFEGARRNALGVDKALDEILDELGRN